MRNRLELITKWRQAFCMMATSGQVGFERYVRDAAEAKIIHRCEISATVALLIQKGVFSELEFRAQVDIEAEDLDIRMQERFPGFSASMEGLVLQKPRALETVLGWAKPYGGGML